MQSQGEEIRSEIQQVSKETKETIEGLRADFASRFEQLRNSWYDTDEATFWANEGRELPGASDIVQATEEDQRLKANAGIAPLAVRIDKDSGQAE